MPERRASQHSEQLQSHLAFARALCDEINNPLMAAAGHVQLLQLALDHDPQAAAAHTDALARELGRVRDRVAKVATLARAGSGDRRREEVRVESLCAGLREGMDGSNGVSVAPAAASATVEGDPDLLVEALKSTLRIAAAVMEHHPTLELGLRDGRLEATVVLPSPQLPEWERHGNPLPLANVRGHPCLALDLFFVQAVAAAHEGSAQLERGEHEPSPRIRVDLGPLL